MKTMHHMSDLDHTSEKVVETVIKGGSVMGVQHVLTSLGGVERGREEAIALVLAVYAKLHARNSRYTLSFYEAATKWFTNFR